ncbi:hypothetical protein Tsubulata_044592 [Turnera subulata]|uniref:Calmodulin-binding domain-containing protein n=1 Tax=Turnera subulata TaxID=218843 RepID=A0A9Q0FT73_9ROSI|nr:hypothetical protein Tsubulata_044592 [Turnera subulata]
MVQRKVSNKLGIQADDVKAEKRLGNLKPTSCHQDGKSRGPDMKKKMKRSRSIKLSDIQTLKPSPSRITTSQPGEGKLTPPPPPLDPPTTRAATLQKQQQPVSKAYGSPNYMKGTSSSEARKERSSQVSSDVKNILRRRSSSCSSKLSYGSTSSSKPTRTLTKPSSFKLVRTLTKTPSFKRGSNKKFASVALCEDINPQKATCSSTLKDSKFPPYLTLNPGGTEAHGTSVMKVCPYTYCSLNGHHRPPLPPLKCFLKARRRSMKLQKSLRLEALSPRRVRRPPGLGKEASDCGNSDEECPYMEAAALVDSAPVLQVVGSDFFIEIYSKTTEDGAGAAGRSTGKDDAAGTTELSVESEEQNDQSSVYRGKEAEADENEHKPDAARLSDASLDSEIDFEEEANQYDCAISMKKILTIYFPEAHKAEPEEEYEGADYPAILSQGERAGSFDSSNDVNDDSISQGTSNMDWEEGPFSTLEFDCLNRNDGNDDDVSSCSVGDQTDIKILESHGKADIITSDDIFTNCTEEILSDEVLLELFGEETASTDEQFHDGRDSEMDCILQGWDQCESLSGESTYDEFSSSVDAVEESATTEEEGKEGKTASASTVEQMAGEIDMEDGVGETEIDIFETDMKLEDNENGGTNDMIAETLRCNQEEDARLQADESDLVLGSQALDCCYEERDAVETVEDYNKEQPSMDITNDQTVAQTPNPNEEEGDADEEVQEKPDEDVAENNNPLENAASETGQADLDSCQQDILQENTNEASKSKIPTSAPAEEQRDSGLYGKGFSEKNAGEGENIEVEVCTRSDTEDTLAAATDGTSLGSKGKSLYRRSSPYLEIPDTCNNRRWTIGSGKPIIELEDKRDFNPRDPNFLPIVPGPEAEKVDLRHQMVDDRKNAEEWMLDYALRQAVTKLGPARKKKVSLLVEAFETVLPIPKYQPHIRRTSSPFSVTRSIQACN